jgi:hypothetical protein
MGGHTHRFWVLYYIIKTIILFISWQ